jgi:hypothetical protein
MEKCQDYLQIRSQFCSRSLEKAVLRQYVTEIKQLLFYGMIFAWLLRIIASFALESATKCTTTLPRNLA